MSFYSEVRKHLSSGRFDGYRLDPSDSDDELLARHLWNLALCAELYPLIHTLELSLRNRVNEVMVADTGRSDWLRPGTQQKLVLLPTQAKMVQEAIADLTKRPSGFTDGHLVAELTFGFWTALFGRQYQVAMRPHLADLFPNLKKSLSQSQISRRIHYIKLLRNRVFHHEPIWNLTGLPLVYVEIVETIEWISADMACSLELFDRFPCTYVNGAGHFLPRVQGFLRDNSL